MGYLDLVGSFIYREPLFRAKLDALAENDAQLKTDGWAQNTKALFFQATVPAGWTQDVSQNDKALRVVGPTGGGGSGGTQALSSTISIAHLHAMATPSQGAHTHAYADHTHNGGSVSTNLRTSTLVVANDGAGLLFLYDTSSGAASITKIEGILKTPGALTLSTQADHTHGALASSLTDFVFAYCDVIVGTKNAPSGTYTDLTTYWHTGDKADFDPMLALAQNDAYTAGNLMPAGAIMIFGQAAAPTGWTKIATVNDRMLRIVSGTGGGSGGTQLISSGVSLAHTHVVTAVADHTHTVPAHLHDFDTDGAATALAADPAYAYIQESVVIPGLMAPCHQVLGLPTSSKTVYKTRTTNSGSGNTGAGGGHSHTLPIALADFTFAYVDIIQCSKDSTGAPYPYVDLTATFAWKKLVSKQRLNNLAKNDAYVEFHTTPVGTQTFFFMASPPSGWSKIVTQDDKALRMVSGGTGGVAGGGSQLVSQTIVLAHTHSVVAQADHTHSIAHTHPIDTGTKTIVEPSSFLVHSAGAGIHGLASGGTGASHLLIGTTTDNPNETMGAAGTHDHGAVTDSQLTNLVLAYADVIWCVKS